MEIKINEPNKIVNSFIFEQETGYELFIRDNEWHISGKATKQELLDAFAAHNPPAPTEPTVQEKLASVGLSVDDLKQALDL